MDHEHSSANLYERIVRFIDEGRCFALATVIAAEGSTPRKTGTKAIIDDSGRIWGTIGGGQVEAQTQQRAVEACACKRPEVFKFDSYGEDANQPVPVCGGSMRILIDPCIEKDRAVYQSAAVAVGRRQSGVLLTGISGGQETTVSVQWLQQGEFSGQSPLVAADEIESCMKRQTPKLISGAPTESILQEVLIEPIIPLPLVLVVGGGHVGQAVAVQASLIGFDIAVLDDRPEFTSPGLFPDGTTTLYGPVGEQLLAFDISADTYIVIVTRGHQHDGEALAACIHSPAAYVGMIGSRRKAGMIRQSFIDSGTATEEQFDRVFSPIGLDIGATTVPEIAASIVAELIAVRRGGNIRGKKPQGASQ